MGSSTSTCKWVFDQPNRCFPKSSTVWDNFAYQDKVVAGMPRANVSNKQKVSILLQSQSNLDHLKKGRQSQANVATRPQERRRQDAPKGKSGADPPIPSEVFRKRILLGEVPQVWARYPNIHQVHIPLPCMRTRQFWSSGSWNWVTWIFTHEFMFVTHAHWELWSKCWLYCLCVM